MIPKFPEYVQMQISNYDEEYISGVIRSDFDSGFSKQRQTTSSNFKQINFEIIVANSRMTDFVNWWKNDIKRGSLWFTFVDPRDLTEKRARMVTQNLKPTPLDAQFRRNKIPFLVEVEDA